MNFSVVTSVYKNDVPQYVKLALESITDSQTIKPDEVVLVVDGPVSADLERVIDEFEKNRPELFKVIRLAKNGGLGNALRIGVSEATHPIIARMDSDDISLSDRFEKQLLFLKEHPDISIVGGQISEFIQTPDLSVGKRVVPCSNDEISTYIKSRCPFNHMAVMMRRADVLEVGNYIDWHYNEDYYLWIRMAEAKKRMANLEDILVNVRVGKEMYARRGGWKYFKSEWGLQNYMLKGGLISLPRYLANTIVRFGVQVCMPDSMRGFLFRKLFRKQ
jgi:glycosyltransferase involved in cell wall biosynthesis